MSNLMMEESVSINIVTNVDTEVETPKLSEKLSLPKRPLSTTSPSESSPASKKAKSASKPFVSSLFNSNPVIPTLPALAPSAKSATEKLFANSSSSSLSFDTLDLHPHLVSNLKQQFNITTMTRVQHLCLPLILRAGSDCLVKSATGSGKTLVFALPLLHSLMSAEAKLSRKGGIRALVILPTHELATQCYEVMNKLMRACAHIVPTLIVGGEKRKSEKARLRKGVNVIVATPGRLLDHIQHTQCIQLDKVQWLIIDEADRMLELGYERAVKSIIGALDAAAASSTSLDASSSTTKPPPRRQTLLLSATLTKGIEQLSEISMRKPVLLDASLNSVEAEEDLTNNNGDDDEVGNEGNNKFKNGEKGLGSNGRTKETAMQTLTTPEGLKQHVIIVPAKLRLVCLSSFIVWKCGSHQGSKARKMLVFMATQDMVDYHTKLFDRCLANEGIDFYRLHGNMDQKVRNEVFDNFRKADTATVLLCTDVASRGLDLPKVNWIVQYNAPNANEDYIHRVGRTARIGATGSSLLFVLPSETKLVNELQNANQLLIELTVDQVLTKLLKLKNPSRFAVSRNVDHDTKEVATATQMHMEEVLEKDKEMHKMASEAYVSFVRSYASYPKEVRHIFCFKALHLGHLAKSFGLRDAPTSITGLGKGNWVAKTEKATNDKFKEKKREMKKEQRVISAQRKRIDQKKLIMSEYESGL